MTMVNTKTKALTSWSIEFAAVARYFAVNGAILRLTPTQTKNGTEGLMTKLDISGANKLNFTRLGLIDIKFSSCMFCQLPGQKLVAVSNS